MSVSRTKPVFTQGDEFEAIVRSYERAGGDGKNLLSPKFASMVVSGNQVLSTHELPGLEMVAEQLSDGVAARVTARELVELPSTCASGLERGTQKSFHRDRRRRQR